MRTHQSLELPVRPNARFNPGRIGTRFAPCPCLLKTAVLSAVMALVMPASAFEIFEMAGAPTGGKVLFTLDDAQALFDADGNNAAQLQNYGFTVKDGVVSGGFMDEENRFITSEGAALTIESTQAMVVGGDMLWAVGEAAQMEAQRDAAAEVTIGENAQLQEVVGGSAVFIQQAASPVTAKAYVKSAAVTVTGGAIGEIHAGGYAVVSENAGSIASTSVGTVDINVQGAEVNAIYGAGSAVSSSAGRAEVKANAVKITLGDAAVGDPKGSYEDYVKGTFAGGMAEADGELKQGEAIVSKAVADVKTTHVEVTGGAHRGLHGGALVMSMLSGESQKGEFSASGHVKASDLRLLGGSVSYATAGGVALLDGGAENASASLLSEVGNASMTIAGGEHAMLYGGGVAAIETQTATGEGVEATVASNVVNSSVTISDGTVYSLVGGGLAFDNGAHDKAAASAHVNSLSIVMTGGSLQAMPSKTKEGQEEGQEGGEEDAGDVFFNPQSALADLSKLYGGTSVVLGGVAYGEKASSTVDSAELTLEGGTVEGAIFMGGVAGHGASTQVKKAVLKVDGVDVDTIFAGGAVVEDVSAEEGNAPIGSSFVEEAVINLVSGSAVAVYGDGLKSGATVGTAVVNVREGFKVGLIEGRSVDKMTVNFLGGHVFEKEEDGGGLITNVDAVTSTGLVSGFDLSLRDKSTTLSGFFNIDSVHSELGSGLVTIDGGATFVGDNTNTSYRVNRGVLALGSKADGMVAWNLFGKTGASAGLYFSGEVKLGAFNGIEVGSTLTRDAADVKLGAQSVLIVDAAKESGTTVEGSISTSEGSRLHFVNVDPQEAVAIELDGHFDTVTTDNLFVKVEQNENGDYGFAVETDGGTLSSLGLDGFDAQSMIALQKKDPYVASLLTGDSDLSGDKRHALLSRGFNPTAAAGVQTAALDAANAGVDVAFKRTRRAGLGETGWSGFAEVTGSTMTFGGSRAALETKTKLGGVAAGGEYRTADFVAGAAALAGTGDVKGRGVNSDVTNDVDYYGLELFAAKTFGSFNVGGLVGWTTSGNDVKADGAAWKADAQVLTLGARVEYRQALSDDWMLLPYAGLNWHRVKTDGVETREGWRSEKVEQDLFAMPVGLSIAGRFETGSGWRVIPSVDASFVHAFGDTDVNGKTVVQGVEMHAPLNVWSENAGRLSFGIAAERKGWTFGAQLGGAVGSDDMRAFEGRIRVGRVF